MVARNWDRAKRENLVAKAQKYDAEARRNKKRPKPPYTIMKSKFIGFCSDCHYTIWQGEKIKYNGRAVHMDCVKALNDNTPRRKDLKYVNNWDE
jgi:hypothetical protein